MNNSDNDSYIRENLAKDYEEDLQAQKLNYIKEREKRIQMEQAELMREKQRIELEDQLEKERKQQIKKMQYQDYLEGMQAKETKLQKEFEDKFIPLGVSLPMNSDERLKSYHNNVYKLSDKADRNRKLFMEYNEKSKNDKYYNYLSKRYTLNKEANQTIPNNKDMPIGYSNINHSDNDGYKNQTFNDHSYTNNIRKKELLNKQRVFQEEKRIEESQRLSQLEKQEKFFENEKKKMYKDYLDRQVHEQIPIKLSLENYDEKNIINSQTTFKNKKLYDNVPHYSTINKSKFVEVNPYCSKNYNLGKSDLENNPILNPMFNYNYNKYLFGKKGGVSRSMSNIPGTRPKNMNIITNEIKDNNQDNYDNNKGELPPYFNGQYRDI